MSLWRLFSIALKKIVHSDQTPSFQRIMKWSDTIMVCINMLYNNYKVNSKTWLSSKYSVSSNDIQDEEPFQFEEISSIL